MVIQLLDTAHLQVTTLVVYTEVVIQKSRWKRWDLQHRDCVPDVEAVKIVATLVISHVAITTSGILLHLRKDCIVKLM